MTEQEASKPTPQRVECGLPADPIVRKLIFALVLLGFGLYCAYDVFVLKKYDDPSQAATWWFNVICAVVLIPVGLISLGLFFRAVRRRLIADEEGIGYQGEAPVAWSDVTKLVIRGKGLMDVHFKADDGEDVLKLDSWLLKNFDDLVALIEAKTEGVPVERAEGK